MSYSDAQHTSRTKPMIAVGLLHAVIAYGFISGLAYEVIPFVDPPIVARNITDDPPPPPKAEPLPPRTATARTTDLSPTQTVIVRRSFAQEDALEVPVLGPLEIAGPAAPPLPTPAARISQARAASPIGSRAAWVTTDDYPPAALREGQEGTVGIDVTLSSDGRVTACAITASSGSALLDGATCRFYARRARFTPALDDEGRPTATNRADRIRWQLPR